VHLDVAGTRLWFDVDGPLLVPDGPEMRRRPTVVLLHGGPFTYDHSYFKPHLEWLTGLAQVVYLDLRGHGRSAPVTPGEWSLERCADDVRGLCATLGIQRPVVVGHSMGAAVALLHAARHPDHPAGVVALSGFARWDHGRLVKAFRRRAGDQVAGLADRLYAGRDVGEEEWQQVYAAFGPHVPDRDTLARRVMRLEMRGYGHARLTTVDLLDRLGEVTAPALVVTGSHDPVTPVAASEEIVAALPDGARLEVLDGAGHFPWLDAPDRLRELLSELIRAVAG
jgi:proline iminopeptidase